MNSLKGSIIIGAIMAAFSHSSSAVTIKVYASGSGWCTTLGDCNNTNTNVNNNTYANDAQGYRNWFAFNLPSPKSVSSASISIWNDSENRTIFGDPTYSLHKASSLSYSGLVSGPVLGSTSVASANTGISHYVTISLNSSGISALNSSLGQIFIFGGRNDSDGSFTSRGGIFGNTTGRPHAYLTLEAVPVPEPSSALLMALGGIALIGTRRKKQSVQGALQKSR